MDSDAFAKFVGSIIANIILGCIMSFPIMWLWNDSLVPAVTWAKAIDWSSAFGLWILVGIFTGAVHTTSK